MTVVFPFVPAPDVAAARWIPNQLQGFAESVVSMVPAGFAAYARVYHPAWHTVNGTRTAVRWAAVAASHGRIAHRQMHWPQLVADDPVWADLNQSDASTSVWEAPNEGSLPLEVARPLWRVLASHTTTAHQCWFAVWDGWGCLPPVARLSPAFDIPQRRLHLFAGAIAASEASFCEPGMYYHQSANMWWPADRAWCVATEIDCMTTYVAGTMELVTALTACRDLEVDQVEPTDGVTWASDTVNRALGNPPT